MRSLYCTLTFTLFTLLGCIGPEDPEGCLDVDQLTGCIDLSQLDSAAHAEAVIGYWELENRIFTEVGELFDDDAGNDCRYTNRSRQSWRFNEDGTFFYDNPDFTIEGTWVIARVFTPTGIITQLQRTGATTRLHFNHVCDDNQAYIDERDSGGEYRRYVRR